MASEPQKVKTVYVVAAPGDGEYWDCTPFVWGVFSTLARAKRERVAANTDHKRTPGTIGSFRIYPRVVEAV